MIGNQRQSKKGLGFFILSLLAFLGLGLDALLALVIEPRIYGKALRHFSSKELISHWIMVCVAWFIVALVLISVAKKKFNFDLFAQKSSIGIKRWLLCLGLLVITIVISIITWNGFKVVKEYQHYGWLQFLFQYLYYIFEAVLFVLMIVFAQHAGEIWFKNGNIPWGGILVALTWGLVHILAKGSMLVGITACLGGLLYGSVYIISKKNLFIAYPLIFLMFVL